MIGSAFAAIPAFADSAPTAEVAAFIKKRDTCDRFRAEQVDPNDIERLKYVEKNLIDYCTGSDEELARLKRQYANDAGITKLLSKYETNIESLE
jgi:hypothetical protein